MNIATPPSLLDDAPDKSYLAKDPKWRQFEKAVKESGVLKSITESMPPEPKKPTADSPPPAALPPDPNGNPAIALTHTRKPALPQNPFVAMYDQWWDATNNALQNEPDLAKRRQMAVYYDELLQFHEQAVGQYNALLQSGLKSPDGYDEQKMVLAALSKDVEDTATRRVKEPVPPGTPITPFEAYQKLEGTGTDLPGVVAGQFYDSKAAEKSGSPLGGLKIGGIAGFVIGMFAGGVFFPKHEGDEPKSWWDTIMEWGVRLLMGLGFATGGNLIQDWLTGKTSAPPPDAAPLSGLPAAPPSTAYAPGSPLPAGSPPPPPKPADKGPGK